MATVPLEDLGVLIIDSNEVLISSSLLGACAEYGVSVIFSNSKHIPVGLMQPIESHSLHAKVLREQIEVTEPVKKRLWQTLVQAKLREQAAVLQDATGKDHGLSKMALAVRSGDPDNLEGQAARIYFPKLFGSGFIRDRDSGGINSLLNYAYIVLRSAIARAVLGSGLHPALGIHHHNQYNAYALADDLIEPLRPLVDFHVFQLVQELEDIPELTPPIKKELLKILVSEVTLDNKRFPLMTALEYYATNTRECLTGDLRKLKCPGR